MRKSDRMRSEFSGKLTLGVEEFAVKRKRFSVEQIVAVLKQAEPGSGLSCPATGIASSIPAAGAWAGGAQRAKRQPRAQQGQADRK